ncbi:glutamate-5-semialdehyde dehydrogenase [Cytobacillus purgationiresistens]|uniref:Gamma-glutamyl phosphate reductase n=1 Tax=Cytobacillus purgationiresistens TaxID=863449 RepID=A0ABU0AHV7_9BACI|nr:glutamate-5-semialdehyde dehydrogenase [Cytobacillus purgationiresistens]MDQ0269660.1 glutamate-5-semialdehyde dehydrogenase [Cytobacillus purgationiresistens]
MNEVIEKGKLAKKVSYELGTLSADQKNEALKKIADQLIEDERAILYENEKDIRRGKQKGIQDSLLDRMMLNKERIQVMADAISQLIDLQDPIGEIIEAIEKENGLMIKKKRVPIGVIGMIYEARPNVTIDAATLALKTGNALLLRGSSSALLSNRALVRTIHTALEQCDISPEAVQLIEDTSRETAKELFHLNEYLDVLIPRGGKELIDTVIKEASVPVIETGAGNCHIYIDETADEGMAEKLVINGKTQRPSVCNATESLVIHSKWFEKFGENLLNVLRNRGVSIHGDETVCNKFNGAIQATEQDWAAEYLGLSISVKVVSSIEEAIVHINQYGTKHSEAIITENDRNAALFLNNVDAAAVYHNASTRFTDGFEFGFGAEIGISTQKLHVRGPMGLEALTSSKYTILGNGQVRD